MLGSLLRLLNSRGFCCRDSSPDKVLAVLLVSLLGLMPNVSRAAKAGGGTKTTCVLTYVNGVQKWVMRVDPVDVESFQLSISFDPSRAQFGGATFKNPFTPTAGVKLSASGQLQVSGTTGQFGAGDVDVFEITFTDLQPGSPIDQVPFTVFATGSDFIGTFDTTGTSHAIISAADIGSTTRSATAGVSPLVWDPDGLYNNGTTGGGGTWDTASVRWDNLPTTVLSDSAWNNGTNVHDVAVFGGNPGTGSVTLNGQISAGGLQFDATGYTLQSGTLTLNGTGSYVPTIDTGENDAAVGSVIAGSAFKKIGSGTLTLSGANTYTGATTVNAGSLNIDFSAVGAPSSNILNIDSTLILAGATFNVTGHSGTASDQSLGGLTVNAGSSAITAAQNGASNLFLSLGGINRNVGGTVDFTLPTAGAISTSANNPNGILGGYATVSGTTWATVSGGNIVGLSGTSYNAVNMDVPNGAGSLSTNPNSIRFHNVNAGSLTISGTQVIGSGGILVTNNVGTNLSISGGTLKGAASADLVVIQNSTSRSFTIGSVISDNTTATGLTKAGAGLLALSSSNTYTGQTLVTAGTLAVDGSIASSPSVVVSKGATLGGSGTVSALSGAGLVSPGTNSRGILTALSLSASAGTSFKFELTQFAPIYSNTISSGNDLLRLTAPTPFNSRLDGSNLITIDFLGVTPAFGDIFTGGFFADATTDFSSMISGANFLGTFNGNALPNGLTLQFLGLVTGTANFSSGTVTGRVMQIKVVPEPGACAMLLGGLGVMICFRYFRR